MLSPQDSVRIETELLQAGAQECLVRGEFLGRDLLDLFVMRSNDRKRGIVDTLLRNIEKSHAQLSVQSKMLKDQNQRLSQLQVAANELIDNVSHDFRTPLNVIQDYVGIIREGLVRRYQR